MSLWEKLKTLKEKFLLQLDLRSLYIPQSDIFQKYFDTVTTTLSLNGSLYPDVLKIDLEKFSEMNFITRNKNAVFSRTFY